ncbi:hypothetical protein DFP72DRAFT_1047411 [Ephemerocybe angulata]|uniref:(4-O-methyl)-D-glucuronate--lignin esterase n=1 Tax=Ephemerocybe angulata TaxID=980116 RepID=A0A8H6HSN5_9AGAR|nr:hypothetical protein DFP72DRAFT_1047411 [Tulosesus angulatus]
MQKLESFKVSHAQLVSRSTSIAFAVVIQSLIVSGGSLDRGRLQELRFILGLAIESSDFSVKSTYIFKVFVSSSSVTAIPLVEDQTIPTAKLSALIIAFRLTMPRRFASRRFSHPLSKLFRCLALGTIPKNLKILTSTEWMKAGELPDPFTFFGGTKVTTKTDWTCRREEINKHFQRLELGTLPPKPASVTGSLSGNTLTVNVTHEGKSISFTASVSRPSGTGPFPAIIALGGASIPIPSGVATITFNNDDIAQQSNTRSRAKGKFYTIYGSGHSPAATTAWAWGVGRIIDVLETIQNSPINESGAGGAACWRISDAMKKGNIDVQTAAQTVGENVSRLSPTFNQYVNRIPDLPIDHHLLAAMSVVGYMKTGTKVFQALGIADRMGVSQVGGHNHCQFPSSQTGDVTAFVDKFLKGNANANTNIVRTDKANNAGFVEATWVNWATLTPT